MKKSVGLSNIRGRAVNAGDFVLVNNIGIKVRRRSYLRFRQEDTEVGPTGDFTLMSSEKRIFFMVFVREEWKVIREGAVAL